MTDPTQLTPDSGPMTSHDRVKRLFEETIKLGMDFPSDDMIAGVIQDAEFDTLNFPHIVSKRHFGDTALLKACKEACGRLAEHAAHDLDQYGKHHKRWYKGVQAVRKHLGIEI